MIIKDNHTSNKIKEVNEKSCNLSKLIIETQLLENKTNIIDCLELDKFEIIRLCRNKILEETNKRETPKDALIDIIETCDPMKQQGEKITKKHQITKITKSRKVTMLQQV